MGSPELTVSRARAAAFLRESLLPPLVAGGGNRSKAVADVVRDLGLIQMDPVRVIGRNHDLVLHNRIEGYRPADYESALSERLVFEYRCGNRSILPVEEYPYFAPSMKTSEVRVKGRLESLGAVPAQVLAILEKDGALPSRAIESEEKVRGYWDKAERTKATSHALQLLWECGRVVASERKNGEIAFDLPERFFPKDLLARGRRMRPAEAERFLILKYYRCYRLFDAGHWLFGFQPFLAPERRAIIEEDERRGLVVPVRIDGTKRRYYCLAADAEQLASQEFGSLASEGAVRILSPLDNFLWRRERLRDLAGFAYTWELYTPIAKRRYGAYTMPVLHGASLPLRLDLKFDGERGIINVQRLYWEPSVETVRRSEIIAALEGELERLRSHLGASAVKWRRSSRK